MLIRLTLRNDTSGAVIVAASTMLGAMPRPSRHRRRLLPERPPQSVAPLVNVPAGTHAIEIRVFDLLQDPTLETLLVGTLAVTPESALPASVLDDRCNEHHSARTAAAGSGVAGHANTDN